MSPTGLSTCVFHCDMLAGALQASKVTSPALTAAYSPRVPGERTDCVTSQEVRDAASLAFFFVQHTITMRIILSKKAIKFFGMNCALQPCGIYCHITAKLDRFLSEPGYIQVKPKARCLPHDARSCSSSTVTSMHLLEGLRGDWSCASSPLCQ